MQHFPRKTTPLRSAVRPLIFCGCAALLGFVPCPASAQNAVGTATLEAYPTYHALGLDVSYQGDDNDNLQAEMHYRLVGEGVWREGVDMTFDRKRKRIWASVFRFQPGQKLDVRVTLQDPDAPARHELTQTAILRAPRFETQGGATYYVGPNGRDSGNGRQNQPFATVARATRNLKPGDTVIIQPGTYREGLKLENLQGTAQRPIVIRGATQGVRAVSLPTTGQIKGEYKSALPILTGKKSLAKGVWKKIEGDVWAAPVSDLYLDKNNRGYLSRNDLRMFWYKDVATLKAAPCDTAPEEKRSYRVELNLTKQLKGSDFESLPAWTYDAPAKMLYLHLEPGDDPNRHSFDYATASHGVLLRNAKHVVVRDLEFSHFAEAGVDLVGDTDNCVILNNLIHHCGNGLKLLSAQSSDNAIWNNQIYDRGLYLYSWRAFMTPLTARNAAQGMPVETGRGISIVGNFVHGYFNSIVPQITGKPDALGANRDMDVLDNMVANNGDDGYEPDGGGVNMRMLDNRHSNTLEGVSAAPIERGPVYIIGNHGVARNYAFKLMNSVPGTSAAFLVHNSHLVVGGGAMRMPAEVQGGKPVAFDQKFIHNNIFVTTGNFISYGRPEVVLDFNAYWRPVRESLPVAFDWNKTQKYATLEEFRAATGLEKNGLIADPRFMRADFTQADIIKAYQNETILPFDLRLLPGSPALDRAVAIRGINGDFQGTAPDLGAFERNTARRYGGAIVKTQP